MNIGQAIEPVDQQPAFVIQRRIAGPAQIVNRMFRQPGTGGIKQAVGRLLVVGTLKEPEEASPLGKSLIVAVIDDRRDASDGRAAAQRQECPNRRIVMKRVVLEAHHLLLGAPQARHPAGILGVDCRGQVQKLSLSPAVLHRNHVKLRHT